MSDRHEGGCLCGQVRYGFTGDPLLVGVCHCRNCQKQSGAPFSLVVSIADALPGLTLIKAGTLDAPDEWAPSFEVYCDRAMPWMPELAAERHALNAGAPE